MVTALADTPLTWYIYSMKDLLTAGNPKTIKGVAKGFLTYILHLAPSTLSGFNVCPRATKGCAAACLNTAGHGGIYKRGEVTNRVQIARIRKTVAFFMERPMFVARIVREIENALKLADKKNLIPVFRLNGTSDIRWETVRAIRNGVEYPNLMAAFPTVQFYDYSKIANRRDIPANYHLTFSLSEDNDGAAALALYNGMNVAVVYKKVPHFDVIGDLTLKVAVGDESDLRFLDPSGVIVGLKAKGRAKKDTSGFVR